MKPSASCSIHISFGCNFFLSYFWRSRGEFAKKWKHEYTFHLDLSNSKEKSVRIYLMERIFLFISFLLYSEFKNSAM